MLTAAAAVPQTERRLGLQKLVPAEGSPDTTTVEYVVSARRRTLLIAPASLPSTASTPSRPEHGCTRRTAARSTGCATATCFRRPYRRLASTHTTGTPRFSIMLLSKHCWAMPTTCWAKLPLNGARARKRALSSSWHPALAVLSSQR